MESRMRQTISKFSDN